MAKKMSRFAHLIGLRAVEEDEDERDENAQEEDDDKKAKKAKSRKAEDEQDDPGAEENDNDDPDAETDNDDPDASEDDEDEEGAEDGDDDKDAKAVKQGRRAERRRCARIFSSQHAAGNPALAAALAFETGMSSAQVIKVMSSGGAPAPSAAKQSRISLDERMASVKTIQLGRDKKPADAGTAKGRAGVMSELYNRVKGVKK
ncbi:hypothetical protein [Trabulsiella odontotermitis]|uniref:Uncharacterized protein n=1 Tax=Trabulsiella odontotermitis TaxID=379893 RepID=A0A0L0GZP1_9ENTR|nr:hypothetical protein [Trabulsiella odontotermitis]KNC94156.1 hypothetical protein GM31_15935 [Trabulsiella odontotermitis]